MNITITPEILFQVAVIVTLVWLVIVVILLKRETHRLSLFKAGLIAHAKAVPTKADQAKLIPQWLDRYDELAVGTPKHTAYKNRLMEVGVLDEDGNRVKVADVG